jgi:hypothetical protein
MMADKFLSVILVCCLVFSCGRVNENSLLFQDKTKLPDARTRQSEQLHFSLWSIGVAILCYLIVNLLL